MSSPEYDATKTGAAVVTEERHETTEETRNSKLETRNCCTALCHHFMESGVYCQSPALRDRRYCYSHLRLRGQRLRMARAIARRQPYRFDLPALDDLYAVQAAVEHVARALGAGLMERRQAGTLLYALQQSAINHRILALVQMNTASVNPTLSNPTLLPKEGDKSAGAPPYSPVFGERVGSDGAQKRLVEDYPEFEEEFGLPKGVDISRLAQAVFPPPEDAWRVPIPAHDPKASSWVQGQPVTHWTKEHIELEELQKRKDQMDWLCYSDQLMAINGRISKQAQAASRRQQEAAWRAEAVRRNAAQEEHERRYASMDESERSAYHLGVLRGLEAAQEQAEEEARKKPAAKAAPASG